MNFDKIKEIFNFHKISYFASGTDFGIWSYICKRTYRSIIANTAFENMRTNNFFVFNQKAQHHTEKDFENRSADDRKVLSQKPCRQFGGLLGQAEIVPVRSNGYSDSFVSRGGLIPGPLQSLIN